MDSNQNSPFTKKPNAPIPQNQNKTIHDDIFSSPVDAPAPQQQPQSQIPQPAAQQSSRPIRSSPQSEILQPMTAQPINQPLRPRPLAQPRVEVEEEQSRSWWKLGLGGFVGYFLVKIFFSGLGGGVGGTVSPQEAEQSKYAPWPSDFRQTVSDSCKSEALKSMKSQSMLNSLPSAQLETMSSTYCSCMIEKMENAHVIKTKHDSSVKTIRELSNYLEATTEQYIASPDGKAAVDECVAKVKK